MRSFFRRNPPEQEKGEAAPKRSPMPYLLALLALQVIAYVVVLNIVGPDTRGRQISLDRFANLTSSGEVREVTILDYDSRVTGRDSDGEFWLALPRGELAVNQLASTLSSSGIPTTIDQQSYKGILNFLAQFLLPVLLFFTLFGALFLLFVGGSGIGGLTLFGKSKARRYGEADEKVSFADVAGLDETIKELEEIRDFLIAPERFIAMGAKVPKGVLLTGPPGCGKTLLARAVAGEAGVPFFSVAASEFVEMLVGVGASRVRDLFRQARENAPSIIFIDELDAVGRSRSGGAVMGNDERDQTLNEMLVQMDGFGSDTRVVVITATNRSDVLDEALTRPGRFDRRIVVDRPDMAGREAILRVHAAGKPLDVDVDLATIARRTPGFSGADLANVLNEAALLAARRGLSSIGRSEIQEGIDRVISGPERSRILSPEEKRRVAVHEAGHALVASILPNADPLEKVSVVARGTSLGHVQVVPEYDRYLMTRTQLLDRITVSLAGRLAELEVFGESSNGATSDLETASLLARHMVMDLGMSDVLPALSYRRSTGEASEHSPRMADAIDGAVAAMVASAEDKARELLRVNRRWLDLLASELAERETLHREDLEDLLAGLTTATPGPVPVDVPSV